MFSPDDIYTINGILFLEEFVYIDFLMSFIPLRSDVTFIFFQIMNFELYTILT